ATEAELLLQERAAVGNRLLRRSRRVEDQIDVLEIDAGVFERRLGRPRAHRRGGLARRGPTALLDALLLGAPAGRQIVLALELAAGNDALGQIAANPGNLEGQGITGKRVHFIAPRSWLPLMTSIAMQTGAPA